MPHKQISPGHQMLRESIHQLLLGRPVEIDDNVAAKDDGYRFVYS